MRVQGLLSTADVRRLADRFPGLEVGVIRVRTIPAGAARLLPGIAGFTIGGTIWIRDPGEVDLPALLAHELTHVRQWRKLGPVGFPVRYAVDYLRGRLRGLGHAAAYRAIPAEQEARETARGFTPD